MSLKQALKKIENARKKFDTAVAEVGRKQIAQALAKFIPDGLVLVWQQYVPRFNDGDPCTFTIDWPRLMTCRAVETGDGEVDVGDDGMMNENDVVVLSELDREDFTDEDDGTMNLEYGSVSELRWTGIQITKKEIDALKAAWKSIPEDVLEAAFGIDQLIVLRPNGKLKVDEYDCGH